ncbi:MAG: AAA family ATPase [Ignavibacteriales bacterium]|nr:AAA family ATPase [Ignavibacteriales bacterium]
MRIDKVYIERFKNLIDFEIDFNEKKMNTILLGRNAAGKSNFIEALVIIFRDLDLNNDPSFKYHIKYIKSGKNIEIIANPDENNKKYEIIIENQLITRSKFYQDRSTFLPKYVFAYYSGSNKRLEEHFDKHQKDFYYKLLDGNDQPLRPFFYARLIHSQFVLMAFYSFIDSKTERFLRDYLNIIGLESVLFILKEPPWSRENSIGDSRFWYSRGVVKDFLNELLQKSLAPIKYREQVKLDFRGKSTSQEKIYLYISNQEKLMQLAELYQNNINFFKVLESTYISELVDEIRIKVKKINAIKEITFKELSEGEQQLLTVLGLLKFTKDEESLILLDEPDTHLNPLWKWKYLSLLNDVVQKPESTQIIISTHDPLLIGGLSREEIRVFYEDPIEKKIITFEPEFDPKGMGVAGILTSDFFGLSTTLDADTQKMLDKKRELQAKKGLNTLNSSEQKKLEELSDKLLQLGFTHTSSDPLYQKFIEAIMRREEFQKPALTVDERNKQDVIANEILDEILQEET